MEIFYHPVFKKRDASSPNKQYDHQFRVCSGNESNLDACFLML